MSRFTVHFSEADGNRIRGAAHAHGEHVTSMITRAIVLHVAALEARENGGEPFPTPPSRMELLRQNPPRATVPATAPVCLSVGDKRQ